MGIVGQEGNRAGHSVVNVGEQHKQKRSRPAGFTSELGLMVAVSLAIIKYNKSKK